MPVLTVQSLSKSFGALDIFSDISFSIPHKSRIGLVGPTAWARRPCCAFSLARRRLPPAWSTAPRHSDRLPASGSPAGFQSFAVAGMSGRLPTLLDRQVELHRLEEQMAREGQSDELMSTYGRLQADLKLSVVTLTRRAFA